MAIVDEGDVDVDEVTGTAEDVEEVGVEEVDAVGPVVEVEISPTIGKQTVVVEEEAGEA